MMPKNDVWCSQTVKNGQSVMQIGMVANFKAGNSIMASIIEIDKVLIKYSQKMTYCHFGVKQRQKIMKIGMPASFEAVSSNMTFIFEIDKVLIKYSQNRDIVSLWCQTTSENYKNWYGG